jgi:hypothetical protein
LLLLELWGGLKSKSIHDPETIEICRGKPALADAISLAWELSRANRCKAEKSNRPFHPRTTAVEMIDSATV